MPKVLNKQKDKIPSGAVYVGRPTKWGNPFLIGVHGTREEVIAKFKDLMLASMDLQELRDHLKGKDLVCWCAPEACHADVLLEYANKEDGPPPQLGNVIAKVIKEDD